MHESRSQKLKLAFGVNELAAELDCSARLVWKEIHSGRMAHTRIGRRVLVTQEQVRDYLHKNSVSSFNAEKSAVNILQSRRLVTKRPAILYRKVQG